MWQTNEYQEKNWETSQKEWETNEKNWKEVGDKPAGNPTTSTQPGRQMKRTGRQMKESGRQAGREPDQTIQHQGDHSLSRPGTRPQAPSLGDK